MAVLDQAVMAAVKSTFEPPVRQAVADELSKPEFRPTIPALAAKPPAESNGAE
jgi:hypothetical protein